MLQWFQLPGILFQIDYLPFAVLIQDNQVHLVQLEDPKYFDKFQPLHPILFDTEKFKNRKKNKHYIIILYSLKMIPGLVWCLAMCESLQFHNVTQKLPAADQLVNEEKLFVGFVQWQV
jgi:hypothetical protein